MGGVADPTTRPGRGGGGVPRVSEAKRGKFWALSWNAKGTKRFPNESGKRVSERQREKERKKLPNNYHTFT